MNHTTRFFTCIAATVLMLTLCSCSITGRGVEGIVYDADTHVPLPDSEILVQWYADFSSPVDSAGHRCIYQTSTRTDANGRFSVPAWTRAKRGNERGVLSGIVDESIHPAITIYRAKYKIVHRASDTQRNGLNKFNVSRSVVFPAARMRELSFPLLCEANGDNGDPVIAELADGMLKEAAEITSADPSLRPKYDELLSYLRSVTDDQSLPH